MVDTIMTGLNVSRKPKVWTPPDTLWERQIVRMPIGGVVSIRKGGASATRAIICKECIDLVIGGCSISNKPSAVVPRNKKKNGEIVMIKILKKALTTKDGANANRTIIWQDYGEATVTACIV